MWPPPWLFTTPSRQASVIPVAACHIAASHSGASHSLSGACCFRSIQLHLDSKEPPLGLQTADRYPRLVSLHNMLMHRRANAHLQPIAHDGTPLADMLWAMTGCGAEHI